MSIDDIATIQGLSKVLLGNMLGYVYRKIDLFASSGALLGSTTNEYLSFLLQCRIHILSYNENLDPRANQSL